MITFFLENKIHQQLSMKVQYYPATLQNLNIPFTKHKSTRNHLQVCNKLSRNLLLILLFTISQCVDYRQILPPFLASSSIDKIQGAIPGHQGQLVYVSTTFNNGDNVIKKYDITLENDIFEIGQYQATTNNNIMTKLYLLNSYLIGYDSSNTIINVFYESNFSFMGEFDSGLQINQFINNPAANSLVLTCLDGLVYHLDHSHFPSMMSLKAQYSIPGVFGTSIAALSDDGRYLSVSSQTEPTLWFYNISSNSILGSYTLNNGIGVKAFCWYPNFLYFYLIDANQIRIFFMNETTSSIAQYTTTLTSSMNIYNLHALKFLPNSQSLVGFAHEIPNNTTTQPQYTRLVFEMNGNIIKNQSTIWDQSTQVSFLTQNNIWWFGVLKVTNTSIQIQQSQPCNSTNEYYDNSIYSCVACTAACTRCTYSGCNSPNGEGNNLTLPSDLIVTEIIGIYAQNVTNTTSNDTQIFDQGQNSTINEAQSQTYQYISEDLERQVQSTEEMVDVVLGNPVLENANKIPGSRKILKLFLTFFVNLDDLALYNYHQRSYSKVMQMFFDQIQKLEEEKWEAITSYDLWGYTGIDLDTLKEHFEYKSQFTSERFMEIEGQPNGFFLNTLNFTLSNFIFTLAIFIALKMLFQRTMEYRVSIFLREYSFWPSLFLMSMEGNLQYFVYLFMFEMSSLVSPNFGIKLSNFVMLTIIFTLLLLSIGVFFYIQSKYRRLVKYFLSNSENKNYGFVLMLCCFVIKNISLGLCHFLFQDSYHTKLASLMFVEVAFLSFMVSLICINKLRSHKKKIFSSIFTCHLMYVLTSLSRIVLIACFMASFNSFEGGDIVSTTEKQAFMFIEILVIVFTMVLWIVYMLHNIAGIIKSAIQSLQSSNTQNRKVMKEFFKNPHKVKFESNKEENCNKGSIDNQFVQQNSHNEENLKESNNYAKVVKFVTNPINSTLNKNAASKTVNKILKVKDPPIKSEKRPLQHSLKVENGTKLKSSEEKNFTYKQCQQSINDEISL